MSRYLVTTNNKITLSGCILKPLEPLDEADAEELLRKICPHIGKNAIELAKMYNGIPLALELVARKLATDTSLSVADYLAETTDDQTYSSSRSNAIPAAVFQGSWSSLTPQAQILLKQLSVFQGSFNFSAIEKVTQLPVKKVSRRELVIDLRRYSLLNWNEETHRYTMLDLLRSFVKPKLKGTTKHKTYLRYANFYVDWIEHYDQNQDQGAVTTDLFNEERTHLDVVWAWLLAADTDEIGQLLLRFVKASVYTSVLSDQVLNTGNRQARLEQWDKVLRVAKKQEDFQSQITALGALADAYTDLDKPDNQERLRQAIACLEQQIEIARQIGDHGREAFASWNLSLALEALDPISIADLERATNLADYYMAHSGDQIKDMHKEHVAKLQTRITTLRYGFKPAYVPEPTSEAFEPDEENNGSNI